MARIRKMVICPKCGQRKIIENETGKKKKKKKKGESRCTVLKSDPPALRTGNDKFRISFSHVQRSLSNRKPAEREREEKKKKKKKTTRTVFSWAHSLQDVQLQVSYGCKSAAWAVLQQT